MTLLVAAVLAAVLPASAPAHVVAVQTEAVGLRQAVRVVSEGPLGAVTVRRDGGDVVLAVEGESSAGMLAPAPAAPIEMIRIEPGAVGLDVRVKVPAGTPYEVRRAGSQLTVLFGRPGPLPPRGPSPDVVELYKRIFPAPDPAQPGGEEEAGGQVVGLGSETTAKPTTESHSAMLLGPVTLRPSVAITYVSANTALVSESATPVHDNYLEVQPRLGAEMGLFDGRLQADYEPKFRAYSSFEQVRQSSHFANAQLELPVGAQFILGATEHYARGTLETNEVDPGGEYFFRLGRFSHNALGLSGKMPIGPRLGLDLRAGYNRIRFLEATGFFGYDTRSAQAGVSLEVTPTLRGVLAYVYERVPPPAARPEAESTAHGLQMTLTGELLPLLSGELAVGYRTQANPGAAAGGRSYTGVSLAASLNREFSRASRLSLAAERGTHASAFEGNAFYVSTATEAALTLPLPLAFSLRGAAGYHWNDYRTISSSLGAARKDRLFGWSFGLGRPLTRWAYVRTDYRKDHRDSNLDAFDTDTDSFMFQIGIGAPGGGRQ